MPGGLGAGRGWGRPIATAPGAKWPCARGPGERRLGQSRPAGPRCWEGAEMGGAAGVPGGELAGTPKVPGARGPWGWLLSGRGGSLRSRGPEHPVGCPLNLQTLLVLGLLCLPG